MKQIVVVGGSVLFLLSICFFYIRKTIKKGPSCNCGGGSSDACSGCSSLKDKDK